MDEKERVLIILLSGMLRESKKYYTKDDVSDYADKIVKLFAIPVVRLSLFNEVYDKFVECEDDNEFIRYLNKNSNEA